MNKNDDLVFLIADDHLPDNGKAYCQVIRRITLLEQGYWQRERDAIVARIEILEASMKSTENMRRISCSHD